MFALEMVRNTHGEDVLHVAGCSDVKRTASKARSYGSNDRTATYTGETLVEALVAADTDMAAWFCEEPYTQSARDNGCWTVLTVEQAPCIRKLIRAEKVTFEAETGRPISAAFPARAFVAPAAALPTCRKCKVNAVPAEHPNWTWCRGCVDTHAAEKRAAKAAQPVAAKAAAAVEKKLAPKTRKPARNSGGQLRKSVAPSTRSVQPVELTAWTR